MRPLRILIAPDKFKGTLTAAEAAKAMATGWKKARPQDSLDLAPISDGGDGFGPILSAGIGAAARRIKSVDAAGRAVSAQWWFERGKKTAVIESANIIGLAMLPKGRFHPFKLDTAGLGKALLAAHKQQAKRCLIGIGGSATNDGGFGVARAIGWKFLDQDNAEITRWIDLKRLRRTVAPKRRRLFPTLTVAVDVQNRLLGRHGCSRVYGPQKGLREADFKPAEAALRQLAKVMADRAGADWSMEPGSGAAGGLGFGLCAFAGARMRPGFDLIARQLKLSGRIRLADIVVSGEGSLDRSTAMGKGVGELAMLCRRHSRPCLGLAGVVQDRPKVARLLTEAHGLCDITSARSAMRDAGKWLSKLAERIAGQIS